MKSLPTTLLAGAMFALVLSARAQDGHIDAGAASTNLGSQVVWVNGADFVDSSGFIKTLEFTNAGPYAGYYQGGITLTSLPRGATNSGPAPFAAGYGALLKFRLSSISAPTGGVFAFWDAISNSPTLSLAGGQDSTNLFRLSQYDGSPASDPFGHIHGRRFTATKPGVYKIGFQAVDASTNGSAGGPMYTPSAMLPIEFQAGIHVLSAKQTGAVMNITYGSLTNRLCVVEYSTNLSNTNAWTPVGPGLQGNDLKQTQQDSNVSGTERYYRVKVDLLPPP